jgi:predicted amidohydrolase
MRDTIHAAAIQLNANRSREKNVARALEMVEQAARRGADLAVLPELFNGYGDLATVIAEAEPIPGPTSNELCSVAREHGIWLCGGSICERTPTGERGYNTSLLIAPSGEMVARYRKLHLFDVNVPGQVNVCESQHMSPGSEIVDCATDLAHFGVAICYDLRFPELFRDLSRRGMEVLLFPSAFTAATGKDHWHVLLRARAIENQCFVVAANQCGRHTERLASYGHSLILDPWGRILAEAGDEETILEAHLDAARLKSVRQTLPALKNRRL